MLVLCFLDGGESTSATKGARGWLSPHPNPSPATLLLVSGTVTYRRADGLHVPRGSVVIGCLSFAFLLGISPVGVLGMVGSLQLT